MTVRIVSPAQKADILNQYRKGITKTGLAVEHAVSPKTINRVLIEMGGQVKNWRSEIRLTVEEAKLIRSIRAEHLNPKDMVPRDTLSIADVFRWFRHKPLTAQQNLVRLMRAEVNTQKKSA